MNKNNLILAFKTTLILYSIICHTHCVEGQIIDMKSNDTNLKSDTIKSIDSKVYNNSNVSDTIKKIDSTAYNFFNDNLIEVYNWIYGIEPSNIYQAISELEKITGIISDSSGDYLGKYNPSIIDYQAWKKWLEDNKFNLCWDYLKKKMTLCNTTR